MTANPPADLQEPAKRAGDTPVGDLESVIPRPMDLEGGDLNAPQPAHHGASWWFSDECSKAALAGITVLSVLLITPTIVYFAINHPSTVVKILAFSFAGVVSVSALLLLVGWMCGYAKMARTGLWLLHIEYVLMWVLLFLAERYDQRKRG